LTDESPSPAPPRSQYRPNYGVRACPAANIAYPILAGSGVVAARLTLAPSSGNAGTIYIGGPHMGGSATGNNGFPLLKWASGVPTSPPLVLEEIELGTVSVLAAVAADSVTWIASGPSPGRL
jgi:hypothetical protein